MGPLVSSTCNIAHPTSIPPSNKTTLEAGVPFGRRGRGCFEYSHDVDEAIRLKREICEEREREQEVAALWMAIQF